MLFIMPAVSGWDITNVDSNSPVDEGTDIVITWDTDENATSYVYLKGALEDSQTSQGKINHSINIGTKAAGTYQYYVKSCVFSNGTENRLCCK